MVAQISNAKMDAELRFQSRKNSDILVCLLSSTFLEDLEWSEQDFYAKDNDFETEYDGAVIEACDEDVYAGQLSDDELLMQRLGLPLSFGNNAKKNVGSRYKKMEAYTSRDNKSILDKETNFLEDSLSELSIDRISSSEDERSDNVLTESEACDKTKSPNLEWYTYWEQAGDELIWASWYQKYQDYIDPKYLECSEAKSKASDASNELIENNYDTSENKNADGGNASDCEEDLGKISGYADEWALLWQDHCSQVYSDTLTQFLSNMQCTNETVKDSGGNNDIKKSEGSEGQSNDPKAKEQNKSSNVDKSEPSDDDDDEPPEEQSSKRKRPHEEEVDGEGVAISMKSALKAVKFEAETGVSNEKKLEPTLLKMKFRTRHLMKRYKKFKKAISDEIKDVKNEIEPSTQAESSIDEDDDVKSGETSNALQPQSGAKKKNKRLPNAIKNNGALKKFWKRRYSLFSRFDEGIQLDAESWYSVTPEKLAIHHAERAKCEVIVDTCCGVGGNAIQFAFLCHHVIAIDICNEKLKMAKVNAQLYGVANKIEFIQGDCLDVLASLKDVDVVFIDPPWGGVGVSRSKIFHLEDTNPNAESIFSAAKKLTDDIVMFMPRNTNTVELISLAGPGGRVEIEKNLVNNRSLTVTAYYGNLVNSTSL